jgi:preprotein translocase subunit SecY
MQLLTIAWPRLEQLAKEGESGQKTIRLWTRWLTGGLALVQAVGMFFWLKSAGVPFGSWFSFQFLQVVITLTAGTAFLMWLGELITDKGIGNGVSLVIFAGIMAALPTYVARTAELVQAGSVRWYNVVFLIVAWVLTVAFIVAVTQAQRKIPIQHVKRVVGNKMYGGHSTYLPLKINSAGVIPIIFAMSIVYFPMTLAQFARNLSLFGWNVGEFLNEAAKFVTPSGGIIGSLVYAGLIIFFTYFYTAVTFNVTDVSDNLKKWGSFIPGIRPGKPTVEYLDRVMTRITLAGAIFLALIALFQYWIPDLVGISQFQLVGGTSLLIVVGVALETMQQIESHLLMRHYEGFIK